MVEKTNSGTASVHSGLSSEAVLASRQHSGSNVLTPPERTPWWKLYLEKFKDPVIRILIVAALIAIAAGAVDGAYIEGAGILCAIVLSTALAFANEYKAGREFELLDRGSDDGPVRVFRDGQPASVPRRDIVVGDVVRIEPGQEIPADGDVIEAVDLSVNESSLTGESEPAPKSAHAPRSSQNDGSSTVVFSASRLNTRSTRTGFENATAYPANRILRGTIVSEGYGTIRITEVGDRTETGRTAKAASEERDELTPLGLQLEKLARVIGVGGFASAALLFVTLVVRGVLLGELRLDPPQWRFAILILASLVAATARIWMPIWGDARALFGGKPSEPLNEKEKPKGGGGLAFAIPILIGGATFGVGFGLLKIFDLLPPSPEPLIPSKAAGEFLKLFMVAVTVVVVAVPEGLAMSVTLCLAYSVRRMAATNNLVRHMHACETIGAASIICTDKTGTLTLNEMRVKSAEFAVLAKSRDLIVQAFAVNSTADLGAKDAPRRVLGNPTEGALLLWLEEQGCDYAALRGANTIIHQLAFSNAHKFMATLAESRGQSDSAHRILHVKGAPEVILSRCTLALMPTGTEPLANGRATLDEKLRGFQARGMRTLGFAFKTMDVAARPASGAGEGEKFDLNALSTDLTWLGFVAIQDPVRPDVPAAIEACQRAGIEVKIVTGDNATTAREIARQAGLWQDGLPADALVRGPAFAAMSDEKARAAALRIKILARSSPHDKLRLVQLLKAAGFVVAVTGDGANDAPALNHANVGLSMGRSGSASAREASDIVLLDDSFNSIVNAIKWGRALYDNIQRFLVFQLTINAAALGLMLAGPFAGVKLPLTVTQMLWINIIMDTLAALALASEPPHDSVMKRPPRAKNAFIITRTMAFDILGTAAIFLVALLALIRYFKSDGNFDTHDSTIVFSVLVLLQFWNLFNARCFGRTASAFKGFFENKGLLGIACAIVVGQLLIVQFGGSVFRTQPLDATEWIKIFAGTSVVLWIGEIQRWFMRRKAPKLN